MSSGADHGHEPAVPRVSGPAGSECISGLLGMLSIVTSIG
jgi:hypothetical protein